MFLVWRRECNTIRFSFMGNSRSVKKDKLRNLFILCPLYYVKAFRDSNLKPQKTWADSVKF